MEIIVQNHSQQSMHQAPLEALSLRVLEALKDCITASKNTLVLVFVEPDKMQSLNSQYRKKNYVTDVLSFSGEEESLGDLIFCISKMREQASDNKHSLESEFLYLLIHGVLHLCGYDHETSADDATEMFTIQDEVFERLQAELNDCHIF